MQQQFNFITENKKAWLDDARHVAKKLLERREAITTDDIWLHCPPPKYINSKIMGLVFNSPEFASTGEFTRSRRPSSHGRHIQKFRLKKVNV